MKDDHKVQKSSAKKYEEHRVHKKCRRKRAKYHSRSRSRSRDSSSSRSRDRSSSRSRSYSRSRSRDLSRSRSRDYSRSRSRDFSRSRSRGYRSRSRSYSRSRSRGRSRSRSRRRSRSDSRSRSKSPVFAKYKYSPEVIRNFRSPDHRKEEKPKVKSEDSRSYESRKDSHRGKSDVNKSYRSRDTKTKSEDSRSNGRNPGINVKPEPLDDNGAQGRSSGRRGDDKPRWGKKDDKDEKKPMENKAKPDFGLSGKLAEEVNTYKGVVIKYSEPPEARMPKRRWRLYPFKGDQALPTLYIHRQSAYLIGRDRVVADLPIDHPSCSKQHAVLQYRVVPYTKENGMKGNRIRPYIIDLDSANGTFVNNKKIEPRKYVELLEKDVIKFAFSSREYVVLHEHSKDDDEDDNVLMVNE